ncbi:MAG: histidine kinase [Actinomycetota bacterium]
MTRPSRGVRLLVQASVVASALLCLSAAFFLARAWEIPALPTEFGPKGVPIAFSLTFACLGAVVAGRRPSNPIGWIFCVLGILWGVTAVGTEYARWAIVGQGTPRGAALYAAWQEEWLWVPATAALAVVAAIFPEGRFLSPRWRVATWITIVFASVSAALLALVPTLTIYEGLDNPLGVGGATMSDIARASPALSLPLMALGAAAVIIRLRRSRGEERQQIKWLAVSTSLVAVMLTFYGVVSLSAGPSPQNLDWAEYLMVVAFLGVPVSIVFGVLKYRLYDIDVVINRAVVYGALAVFITAVYIAIVVGVGTAVGARGDAALSAVAAAVVALAFQPARRWAQHLANRLVYGDRATPYEVLSELSARFADTYSLEDSLPRLARVTAEAVGAEGAVVWLRDGEDYTAAAAWPADVAHQELPGGNGARARDGRLFEIRHQGEPLGAISVRTRPNEPLAPPQEKLLNDVAAQAGLVLRNVALVQDLRSSRLRIVTAQDERARKLERDIHDGAQQQLVALAVKLRLADTMVGRDDGKAHEMLAELGTGANDALETLRDLARGIYPPLLADQGLSAALEAQARKAPVPTTVNPDGLGRFDRDVEATTYFCVLEAIQNVAKHAQASAVTITLSHRDGYLVFEVTDDGRGFDPGRVGYGTGLQGMADRLAALGGTLDVSSAPDAGTSIRGNLPAETAG